MKLVIIGVVVLALLGGGGFAGWWFFMADQEETEPEAPVVSAVEPEILQLEPLEVPIMVDGVVTHRVTFELYLDLLPGHSAKVVKKEMPKIRDAIYSELHSLFGLRYVRDLNNIVPLVKKRVRAATDKALGGHTIGAVLISNINRKRTLDHHKHELTGRSRAGRGQRIIMPSSTN